MLQLVGANNVKFSPLPMAPTASVAKKQGEKEALRYWFVLRRLHPVIPGEGRNDLREIDATLSWRCSRTPRWWRSETAHRGGFGWTLQGWHRLPCAARFYFCGMFILAYRIGHAASVKF